LANARPAPDVYPSSGASALATNPLHDAGPQDSAGLEPMPAPARQRAPYQPALFPTRDLGRVVPIEAYKQRATERRERAQQAESAAVYLTPDAPFQTDLPFPAAAVALATPRRSGTGISEARFSEAPVAIPVHRLMAAAMDFGMVMVAAGLLCVIVAFGAKDGFLPGQPLYWFAASGVTLSILYKLFWAAVQTDSPGLRWCQLRLLHFDGREPEREERLARIGWSLMSVMAGGLGLVWAMVDEETLSWHDHSSKTFLTPYSRAKKGIR
jgi:uncharacterized RDD family membrane protein YckC